jgi:ParB family transcriptional regulator, chromosome partitioning protein
MLVKIKDIKVKNRIRNDLGDLTSLQESIMKLGLLHPIIINEKYELISGLRRLYACRNIGWTEIEAEIVPVKDDLTELEIESHENLIRKDFNEEEIENVIRKRKELTNKGFFRKIIDAIIRFFKWIASLFKGNKKNNNREKVINNENTKSNVFIK